MDSFWLAQKNEPCSEGFVLKVSETLISCWDIYVFVSFNHSIALFGLISTGSEKWALFWRFCAEMLISCWDIYVFVSFSFIWTHCSLLRYLCIHKFDHSIYHYLWTHFGSEKRALFWRFHVDRKTSPVLRFHAVMLISCWDIYPFISFNHSIPLFGLILTSSEKWALFWRFCAEMLISCWDIYVFVTIWTHFDFQSIYPAYNHSINLESFQPARKNKPCSEGFVQ